MNHFSSAFSLAALIVLLALMTTPSLGDVVLITFQLPRPETAGVGVPSTEGSTLTPPASHASGSFTTGSVSSTGGGANHGRGRASVGGHPLRTQALPGKRTWPGPGLGTSGSAGQPTTTTQADDPSTGLTSADLLDWVETGIMVNPEPSMPNADLPEVDETSAGSGTLGELVFADELSNGPADLGDLPTLTPPPICQDLDVAALPELPAPGEPAEMGPNDIGAGNVVPEPSAGIVWLLLGSLGIGIGWWRRQKAQ